MSEIPQDIVEAVDALLDAAIAANDDVSTEQMMARAIMAERNRCARIAEERAVECMREHDNNFLTNNVLGRPAYFLAQGVALQRCAASIRNVRFITGAGRAALAEKEGMK